VVVEQGSQRPQPRLTAEMAWVIPSIILSGQGVAVHEPPDSRYELLTHRMPRGK